MSRLPVETTNQILGYLDPQTDLSTQSACALTCRAFLQETRRSRFRRVAVNGDKACKLLRLMTVQDVLRCVRNIRLQTEVYPKDEDRTSSWIPGLLEAFPPDIPVQKVRLTGLDDVTDALIAILASKFKFIESLHYDCCDLVIHPDDLALLILPFQELQAFKFTIRADNFDAVPGISSSPPDLSIPRSTLGLTTLPRPHRLSRLDIHSGMGRFHGDNRASVLFDAIVTHKLHEHVRDFRFASLLLLCQQPAELATFVTHLGPQLTSLTIGSYAYWCQFGDGEASRRTKAGGRQILHGFTSLRTVKLRDILHFGHCYDPLMLDLLRMLPASITSITLEFLFSDKFKTAPNDYLNIYSKALNDTLLECFPALQLVHVVLTGKSDTIALAIEKMLTPRFQALLASERPKGAPNLKVTFGRAQLDWYR